MVKVAKFLGVCIDVTSQNILHSVHILLDAVGHACWVRCEGSGNETSYCVTTGKSLKMTHGICMHGKCCSCCLKYIHKYKVSNQLQNHN